MKHVHVVAGALVNARTVLLARRPDGVHLGGLWEFPGGKVEAGESACEALVRELSEEIGIAVRDAKRLYEHTHAYPEKTVRLDIWCVTHWDGAVVSGEGQPLVWVDVDELTYWPLPEADAPAVALLQARVRGYQAGS